MKTGHIVLIVAFVAVGGGAYWLLSKYVASKLVPGKADKPGAPAENAYAQYTGAAQDVGGFIWNKG